MSILHFCDTHCHRAISHFKWVRWDPKWPWAFIGLQRASSVLKKGSTGVLEGPRGSRGSLCCTNKILPNSPKYDWSTNPTVWRGLLQQKSGFPPHLLLQKQENWEPWEVLKTLLKPIFPPYIGAMFSSPMGWRRLNNNANVVSEKFKDAKISFL